MPYADLERRRDYARGYSKAHYEKNKPAYKARARTYSNLQRERITAWLFDYLQGKSCRDCGEVDIVVLEFDHREGERKKFAIGSARCGGYSIATIAAEVAKCDIRCANCHRRATYRRAGRKHRG